MACHRASRCSAPEREARQPAVPQPLSARFDCVKGNRACVSSCVVRIKSMQYGAHQSRRTLLPPSSARRPPPLSISRAVCRAHTAAESQGAVCQPGVSSSRAVCVVCMCGRHMQDAARRSGAACPPATWGERGESKRVSSPTDRNRPPLRAATHTNDPGSPARREPRLPFSRPRGALCEKAVCGVHTCSADAVGSFSYK